MASRFVLYPENDAKVEAAVRRLQAKGITMSANRFMNLLAGMADSMEVIQEVELIIKTAPDPSTPKKQRKLRIRRPSRWIDEFRITGG